MSAGKPTQARAIIIDRPGSHRLVRGPRAEPRPGEARVAVHATGLCTSDHDLYHLIRAEGCARYPITPGHEWSGTVDAVGEGVDRSLVGRRVVGEGLRACQVCERCRSGETSLCMAGYDETGFTQHGSCADVLTLPARLLHLLPDEADLRAAALLEPAAVAAAAVRAGQARPGERVAVLGAEALGLLSVQLLSACSPMELLTVDSRVQRAEQALSLGATDARVPEAALELTDRYDLVMDTAGAPTSAQDACLLARRGGRVVLAGLFGPGAEGIDPVHLSLSRLTVRSVLGAGPAAWVDAVRAFRAGLLDPGRLITHELPLTEFAEAIALVGSDRTDVGKVLLRN